MRNRKIYWDVFVIGLGVVVFGLIISYDILSNEKQLEESFTEQTEGIVTGFTVRLEQGVDFGYIEWYYPVYQYEVDGRVYRQESPNGNKEEICPVGQKVTVRYNPEYPNEYYVVEHKTDKNFGFHFFIISILVLMFGLYVTFRSFKRH